MSLPASLSQVGVIPSAPIDLGSGENPAEHPRGEFHSSGLSMPSGLWRGDGQVGVS